ncbi:hypothetical protein MP228_003169 [Amoeboaphelidium protococcarum]|nr:hypothetical protein MP228_003169 [Amoeboaphelidium protococcarum]
METLPPRVEGQKQFQLCIRAIKLQLYASNQMQIHGQCIYAKFKFWGSNQFHFLKLQRHMSDGRISQEVESYPDIVIFDIVSALGQFKQYIDDMKQLNISVFCSLDNNPSQQIGHCFIPSTLMQQVLDKLCEEVEIGLHVLNLNKKSIGQITLGLSLTPLKVSDDQRRVEVKVPPTDFVTHRPKSRSPQRNINTSNTRQDKENVSPDVKSSQRAQQNVIDQSKLQQLMQRAQSLHAQIQDSLLSTVMFSGALSATKSSGTNVQRSFNVDQVHNTVGKHSPNLNKDLHVDQNEQSQHSHSPASQQPQRLMFLMVERISNISITCPIVFVQIISGRTTYQKEVQSSNLNNIYWKISILNGTMKGHIEVQLLNDRKDLIASCKVDYSSLSYGMQCIDGWYSLSNEASEDHFGQIKLKLNSDDQFTQNLSDLSIHIGSNNSISAKNVSKESTKSEKVNMNERTFVMRAGSGDARSSKRFGTKSADNSLRISTIQQQQQQQQQQLNEDKTNEEELTLEDLLPVVQNLNVDQSSNQMSPWPPSQPHRNYLLIPHEDVARWSPID